MSDKQPSRTLLGAEAAVELAKEWNDDVRADRLEVELQSGKTLVVDEVGGELRIRRKEDVR